MSAEQKERHKQDANIGAAILSIRQAMRAVSRLTSWDEGRQPLFIENQLDACVRLLEKRSKHL